MRLEIFVFVHNNAYLKRLYNMFNKKYFYGDLPDIVVGYATTKQFKSNRVKRGTCAFTSYDDEKHTKAVAIVIHTHPGKSMAHIKSDLIHEIAHVAHPRADHGKAFQDEMKRLAQAGAFEGIW